MSIPKWYEVLIGRHWYGEGPEQERQWVRDAFYMGLMLGVLLTLVLIVIFM